MDNNMSFDDYANYLSKKLQLAVAIAVIKSKPNNTTTDKHLQEIKSKISNEMEIDDLETSIYSEDFNLDIDDDIFNESNDINILNDNDINISNSNDESIILNNDNGIEQLNNQQILINDNDLTQINDNLPSTTLTNESVSKTNDINDINDIIIDDNINFNNDNDLLSLDNNSPTILRDFDVGVFSQDKNACGSNFTSIICTLRDFDNTTTMKLSNQKHGPEKDSHFTLNSNSNNLLNDTQNVLDDHNYSQNSNKTADNEAQNKNKQDIDKNSNKETSGTPNYNIQSQTHKENGVDNTKTSKYYTTKGEMKQNILENNNPSNKGFKTQNISNKNEIITNINKNVCPTDNLKAKIKTNITKYLSNNIIKAITDKNIAENDIFIDLTGTDNGIDSKINDRRLNNVNFGNENGINTQRNDTNIEQIATYNKYVQEINTNRKYNDDIQIAVETTNSDTAKIAVDAINKAKDIHKAKNIKYIENIAESQETFICTAPENTQLNTHYSQSQVNNIFIDKNYIHGNKIHNLKTGNTDFEQNNNLNMDNGPENNDLNEVNMYNDTISNIDILMINNNDMIAVNNDLISAANATNVSTMVTSTYDHNNVMDTIVNDNNRSTNSSRYDNNYIANNNSVIITKTYNNCAIDTVAHENIQSITTATCNKKLSMNTHDNYINTTTYKHKNTVNTPAYDNNITINTMNNSKNDNFNNVSIEQTYDNNNINFENNTITLNNKENTNFNQKLTQNELLNNNRDFDDNNTISSLDTTQSKMDSLRTVLFSQESQNFSPKERKTLKERGTEFDKTTPEEIANNNENIEMDDFENDLEEIVPFKVMEELNKVKIYLRNQFDKKIERSSNDTGYRSDSQKSLRASQTNIWVNQSAHSLFTHLAHCSLVSSTQDINKEISVVLGHLIDKLHEDEIYPSFLEELLDTVHLLIQLLHEDDIFDENEVMKKDEYLQRILLFTKSLHIQKYAIDKINSLLEKTNTDLISFDAIQEIKNIKKIENLCHIFHLLQILLKRHIKYKNQSQNTQNSSQNSQESIKKSDLSQVWKRKWNNNAEIQTTEIVEQKCVLKECSKVLNKIIVVGMESYSLISYFALKCFNLMQN